MSTIGLVNLGNTCFLNSCVQVLSMIPEFQQHKSKWQTMLNGTIPSWDKMVLAEWLSLQQTLSRPIGQGEGQYSTHASCNPQSFVVAIHRAAQEKGHMLFSGYAQNDMPEFLLFFIDTIHRVIQRSVDVQIHGTPTNQRDKLAIACYSLLQNIYAKEYSECLEMFFGVYVSQIKRPMMGQGKGHQQGQGQGHSHQQSQSPNPALSVKPEHFFVLDLPIPRDTSNKSMHLLDCFDEFCALDWLEGENAWRNDDTGKVEPRVSKNMTFWSFPPILILVIKRFVCQGSTGYHHQPRYVKYNGHIDFPLTGLNLSKYVDGYKPHTYVYDLFGICNHFGTCQGGHYTAFAKHPEDGKWRLYNDSSVSMVHDEQQVVTPAAYCLFYRRRG